MASDMPRGSLTLEGWTWLAKGSLGTSPRYVCVCVNISSIECQLAENIMPARILELFVRVGVFSARKPPEQSTTTRLPLSHGFHIGLS